MSMKRPGYWAVLTICVLWGIAALMAIYAFGESLGYWRAIRYWEGCGA